jgi:hypothetical protein
MPKDKLLSPLAGSIYRKIYDAGTEAYLSALAEAANHAGRILSRAGIDRESRAWIKFSNATNALGRELLEAASDELERFKAAEGPKDSADLKPKEA